MPFTSTIFTQLHIEPIPNALRITATTNQPIYLELTTSPVYPTTTPRRVFKYGRSRICGFYLTWTNITTYDQNEPTDSLTHTFDLLNCTGIHALWACLAPTSPPIPGEPATPPFPISPYTPIQTPAILSGRAPNAWTLPVGVPVGVPVTTLIAVDWPGNTDQVQPYTVPNTGDLSVTFGSSILATLPGTWTLQIHDTDTQAILHTATAAYLPGIIGSQFVNSTNPASCGDRQSLSILNNGPANITIPDPGHALPFTVLVSNP